MREAGGFRSLPELPAYSGMADPTSQTSLDDFAKIFSLEGKVIVITGGSRGLGLHAASGYLPPFPHFLSNPLFL